jgi:hypothetical protein
MDSLDKIPKLRKMDMILGAWNVRSLYRAEQLMIFAEKISKYKLDLAGIQEVRWTEVSLKQQANIHFSMERGTRIMNHISS